MWNQRPLCPLFKSNITPSAILSLLLQVMLLLSFVFLDVLVLYNLKFCSVYAQREISTSGFFPVSKLEGLHGFFYIVIKTG